jgi:peptide/nickel transport system permease protein
MRKLILRRLATLLPTALLGTLMLFLLLQLVPGGVAAALAGTDATPEVLAQLERELGLDRPLYVQYQEWLERIVLRGDFGRSLLDRRPIAEAMLYRLPLTVELAVLALLVALMVGVPLGIAAATHRHTVVDSAITSISGLGLAMPEFWLAMIAVNLFALQWALLPATGIVPLDEDFWGHVQSMIMPVLTLASGATAAVTRFTRSGMMEALSSSYARTALSLGLSQRQLLFRFALRNALIPLVTVVGLLAGGILGGAVLVEQVFAIHGLGDMFVTAVQQKDYPTVQGVAVVLIGSVIGINLAVDILCGLLDPRIRG